MQHICSAHTEEALNDLISLAEEWTNDYTMRMSIFPDENPEKRLPLTTTLLSALNISSYKLIHSIKDMTKLDDLPALLNDLVWIRLFEPASLFQSFELMELFF